MAKRIELLIGRFSQIDEAPKGTHILIRHLALIDYLEFLCAVISGLFINKIPAPERGIGDTITGVFIRTSHRHIVEERQRFKNRSQNFKNITGAAFKLIFYTFQAVLDQLINTFNYEHRAW